MVHPLWKTAWWFLKKLGIALSYDPIIPLLGIYPKEVKAKTQTLLHPCSQPNGGNNPMSVDG
jgi:hypothetical protein